MCLRMQFRRCLPHIFLFIWSCCKRHRLNKHESKVTPPFSSASSPSSSLSLHPLLLLFSFTLPLLFSFTPFPSTPVLLYPTPRPQLLYPIPSSPLLLYPILPSLAALRFVYKICYSEITFQNFIKLNQIWFVIRLYRLIWRQTEYGLVTHQS